MGCSRLVCCVMNRLVFLFFASALAGSLAATEFGLPAQRLQRSIFTYQSAEDEWTRPKLEGFAKFALGSHMAHYPYEAPADDLQGSRNWYEFFALDLRAAAQLGQGVGGNGDARFRMFFAEVGGLLRHWDAREDTDRWTVYGGWVGGTIGVPFYLPVVRISQGFGLAEVRDGRGKSRGGVLINARVLAFPLWPLSFMTEVGLVATSDHLTVDAGTHIGVMAYRHIFVEAGYRLLWVGSDRNAAHGFSIGLAFYWTMGGFFTSPSRPNTW